MKRVLIAPLDWGLGHATRCIPIVRMLLKSKCEVLLAGSGNSLAVLRREFPELKFFFLPAYDPQYSVTGSMVSKMISQLPHFARVIAKEHRTLEKIVVENKLDIVIADNRFGCWSSNATSVFITHQSNILMPRRFGWLSWFVRKINLMFVKKFDVCWVPDDPNDSLAGDLVYFGRLPANPPAEFIGHLSRFTQSAEVQQVIYDIVVILSGPEPQRTLLEKIVSAQLIKSSYKYFIVRGLPELSAAAPSHTAHFLDSVSLQHLLHSSHMVIARSGYSTVMDMASLGKKAIFIPTPGQTEQVYLAKRLREKKIAFSMDQNNFDLELAMQRSSEYMGFPKRTFSHDLLNTSLLKLIMR
jgi:uncharacterized protein (TIGR00661 family)